MSSRLGSCSKVGMSSSKLTCQRYVYAQVNTVTMQLQTALLIKSYLNLVLVYKMPHGLKQVFSYMRKNTKESLFCLVYFAQGRAIYIQNLARPQPSFVSLGTHIYVASTRTNYLCIASTYVNNCWLHAYFQLVLCNLKDCIKVMTKLSRDTVLILVVLIIVAIWSTSTLIELFSPWALATGSFKFSTTIGFSS